MRLASFLMLMTLAAAPTLAQTPVGSQFQINSYTTDYQVRTSARMFPDGSFVVVWESGPNQVGAVDSIRARRFASDGTPLAGDFQVNSYVFEAQRYSAVSGASDGSFVVVWQQDGSPGNDSSFLSIQARRFASDGNPIGDQFQVNSSTAGSQRTPWIATDSDGDFTVVWTDENFLRAQRYASDGSPMGGEFDVNTVLAGHRRPVIESLPDDGFLVAWESFASIGNDNSERTVQARRYASDGSAVGDQFQVNTYTTGIQGVPDIAVHDDGRFIIAWHSDGSPEGDDSFFSSHAQRFASDGTPVGDQFQLNTFTPFGQNSPSVVYTSDAGDFFATWSNVDNPDIFNFTSSARAQRFRADGTKVGGEFQVPTYLNGSEYFPEVVTNGAGSFLVSWSGTGSGETDTSQSSVHGQLFQAPSLFSDGFESGDTTAWSGAQP